MTTTARGARIVARAGLAGVDLSAKPDLVLGLETFLDVLARWNRRINLTSLDLNLLPDDAIDRLIVEPMVAAGHVRAIDRAAMDIGSGGGSPALPLKLAVPALRMVLVEARARKGAFLREAVRELALSDVEVATARFEDLVKEPGRGSSVDLVTLRGVKTTPEVWAGVGLALRPGGRVFWFSTAVGSEGAPAGFAVTVEDVRGRLRVLEAV